MALLTSIRAKMAELIGAMSVADGYNLDWGSVNKFNTVEAQEEFPTLPSVDIKTRLVKPLKIAAELTNICIAEIEISLPVSNDNEIRSDIQEEGLSLAESALEDLEDLFYKVSTVATLPIGVTSILPDEEGTEIFFIQNDALPVRLRSRWKITFNRVPGGG